MSTKLINCKEASVLLGLPEGTVYALVHNERIPHKRFGPRFVRFVESELLSWITDHSVQPKVGSKKTPQKSKK